MASLVDDTDLPRSISAFQLPVRLKLEQVALTLLHWLRMSDDAEHPLSLPFEMGLSNLILNLYQSSSADFVFNTTLSGVNVNPQYYRVTNEK